MTGGDDDRFDVMRFRCVSEVENCGGLFGQPEISQSLGDGGVLRSPGDSFGGSPVPVLGP